MALITAILGGVGIFLVGMILLTEGLKAAAGSALRGILQRVARGPASAMASGAAITAVVQSSSATTLTTIGFVSAGLLTFPQAVGLIFGANLGTTSTGWIVSVLGLKVSVGAVALPLVGVGALIRLLGSGRKADAGLALAGFGLIFVGIDALQVGMEGLAQQIDPAAFPGATPWGRAGLVGIGMAMTVVMQSSSAAVATVLTALHAGTLTLEQTAYLVIGQNVGTTVKAALAAVGASVPARRTAVAHIGFNLGAGLLAVVALPVLLPLSVRVVGEGDPAMAIALFHTTFNLLGVAVFLPAIGPFSALVERLVPERAPLLTRHLDRSVTHIPAVAVEAARRATWTTARVLFQKAADGPRPGVLPSGTVEEALARIRAFLGEIHTSPDSDVDHRRHLSVIHAVDHLDRAAAIVRERPRILWPAQGPGRETWSAQRAAVQRLLAAAGGEPADLTGAASGPSDGRSPGPDPALADALERVAEAMATVRKEQRDALLRYTAQGTITPDEAWDEVERLRKADALAYHAWRAVHHLGLADPEGSGEASGEGPEKLDPEDAERSGSEGRGGG